MATKQMPIDVVGSTVFGRYPKISCAQTYNMMISDNWLVPFAGYRLAKRNASLGVGRGIYHSAKLNKLIFVVDNQIYTMDENELFTIVGTMDTFTTDVSIAENDANQIAFSDQENIYIYNYVNDTVDKVVVDFVLGDAFISFVKTSLTKLGNQETTLLEVKS